jgi:hypothetical protein
MDNIKRHSIGGKLKPDRRGSGSSQKAIPYKPARLWLSVESPPLVSFLHCRTSFFGSCAADRYII